MESISPITLRKALDALALPEHDRGHDRDCRSERNHTTEPEREPHHKELPTGAAAWTGLGAMLVAAALGAACAISAWGVFARG